MIVLKILFVIGIVLTWVGTAIIYKTYPMANASGIILEIVGYIMIAVAVMLHEKRKE
jgi:hypothetical protein